MPLVTVMDAPGPRRFAPTRMRFTWPISLLWIEWAKASSGAVVALPKAAPPAVLTTASTAPTASNIASMLAGSSWSTCTAPFREARRTSWPWPSKRCATAAPIVPVAPTTKIRFFVMSTSMAPI